MNKSLIAQALGSRFGELHPAIRQRYSFASEDGKYSVGEGVMHRIWSGSPLFAPFLWLGSKRNIMFPGNARDVRFRIECWAYRDSHGRETLSLNRTYDLSPERRFDEYIVAVPESSSLVIYAGTHQHLAVEFRVGVTARGGLEFTTGRQRLMVRRFSFLFPMLFSATAGIEEFYDDSASTFRIDGRVRNGLVGEVFGCIGEYQSRIWDSPDSGIPAHIRPVREELRW